MAFGLFFFIWAWTVCVHAGGGEEPSASTTRIRIPFFDGIKLQTTNIYPKLTNANHMIRDINTMTGSSLRDWDTIWVESIDIVLWKDLSKYFKTDFAVAYSSGSLLSSSTGFRGMPMAVGIRMRQRYSALAMWTNLYFYPLTTNCRDEYRSGLLLEPFVAAGLGYTYFRSESVFKLRKQNLLYDRVRVNWNDSEWGCKLMVGFNLNLGKINPRLEKWLITVSAFQVWNRLKGNAVTHFTDGLKLGGVPVNVDLRASRRMDIDLSGQYYSLAIGVYF